MADEKPKGYLARYGGRLIDAGYQIIPIRRGSKAPPEDGWQKIRATKKDVRTWTDGASAPYSRAGVGILTRLTPAADLDILDEACALHMQAWIEEHYGFAPVRIGLAPKRLMLFRTDTPFPKVNSVTFEDEWGDPQAAKSGSGKLTGHLRKVEILGDGQQFVAYHIHPDTGSPYEWITKDSPLTVNAADLPVLTHDDALAIVAEFERYAVAAGWTPHEQSRALTRPTARTGVGRVATDDVFAADKQKTDISDEDLHRKLLLVNGYEDYETWLQIGMALWHQYDGEELGLQLWHEWSIQANNYDAEALDSKWETFDVTEKGRTPVTARLIIKLADEQAKEIATETFREIKEELASVSDLDGLRAVCAKIKHIEFDVFARNQIVGLVKDKFKSITGTLLTVGAARDMVRFENPEPKELPQWLDGWVYINRDKTFFDRKKRYAVSTEAFNAMFARFMLTKREILEGKSVPETMPAPFALNNKQIPIVRSPMYMPGEDDLFWVDGVRYVNSYNDENVPETPTKMNAVERDAVETAKGHFAHLFENVRDRTTLLDAIAFLVQNPGKRLNWAIMMQGVESDGKTWFAGLLSAVLGPENVNNLAASSLEEKFSSWSEGAQVVFFEEIRLHGHNRYDVLNKVKPLITNRIVSVRRMNTDVYQAINQSTYFLTTNFRDALPLDDNDSRYFILFSRFQRKSDLEDFEKVDPNYYQRLYDALEHGGALRKWLLGHKISPHFSGVKRAPASQAKTEMVRYAMSEETETFREILATSTRSDLCDQLLSVSSLAEQMSDLGCDVPYGKAMSKLLLDAGFTKLGKVRIGEGTQFFWSRTCPDRFMNFDGTVNPLAVRDWLKDDL